MRTPRIAALGNLAACGTFAFGQVLGMAALPAAAASLTAINSYNGSTGYVEGRPLVIGGVVYGVLGNTPPPNGNVLTGSVYTLTPPASGTTYTQATIATFSGGANGGNPVGGLYADASGNLYGAAFSGGNLTSACTASSLKGCGLIYKLTKSGSTWTNTPIYKFTGGADGIGPVGNLIGDTSGNLYGITEGGGCTPSLFYPIGCGIVFKLTPPASGNTWASTILATFQGGSADGAEPIGSIARDAAGNIYGTTQYGGTEEAPCGELPNGAGDGRCGTAFKLTYTASNNTYAKSILHFFTDGTDGSIPSGGAVIDSKGNVYGTTLQGGNSSSNCTAFGYSGCGLVFQLAAANSYSKTNIHVFSGIDGASPALLAINAKSRLFGVTSMNSSALTTCTASAYYCGTAYQLTPTTSTWVDKTLYTFTGVTNNITGPEFGLAVDTLGKIYGVSINNVTSTIFTLTGTTP
jgi:hypothetical protein